MKDVEPAALPYEPTLYLYILYTYIIIYLCLYIYICIHSSWHKTTCVWWANISRLCAHETPQPRNEHTEDWLPQYPFNPQLKRLVWSRVTPELDRKLWSPTISGRFYFSICWGCPFSRIFGQAHWSTNVPPLRRGFSVSPWQRAVMEAEFGKMFLSNFRHLERNGPHQCSVVGTSRCFLKWRIPKSPWFNTKICSNLGDLGYPHDLGNIHL